MSEEARTFIVTGGSRGIGLECVKILLDAPFAANVVSLSRTSPPELEGLTHHYPGSLVIEQGDASDDHANAEAVNVALQAFGRLDGVILNHGIIEFGNIADLDLDALRKVIEVNLVSQVSMLKHALPELRRTHGRVVFTSSGAAVGGTAAWGSYNLTKAALNSLCRTVASEEPNVAFLAVRPGMVDTPMQEDLRTRGKEFMTPKDHQKFLDVHSQGKLVPPSEPAHVMAAFALAGEHKLSGGFYNWDSDELKHYRKKQRSA